MEEHEKKQILKSIALTGGASEESAKTMPIIANLDQAKDSLIDRSGGLPRIKAHLTKKFNLILAQPLAIREMSSLEIRCCLCGNVISYPAWHYVVKFTLNVMHFFVCFDSSKTDKPTTRCMRRRV